MPATSTEAIVEVADRLFTAIENGDMAAVGRLWSEDIERREALFDRMGVRDHRRRAIAVAR